MDLKTTDPENIRLIISEDTNSDPFYSEMEKDKKKKRNLTNYRGYFLVSDVIYWILLNYDQEPIFLELKGQTRDTTSLACHFLMNMYDFQNDPDIIEDEVLKIIALDAFKVNVDPQQLEKLKELYKKFALDISDLDNTFTFRPEELINFFKIVAEESNLKLDRYHGIDRNQFEKADLILKKMKEVNKRLFKKDA